MIDQIGREFSFCGPLSRPTAMLSNLYLRASRLFQHSRPSTTTRLIPDGWRWPSVRWDAAASRTLRERPPQDKVEKRPQNCPCRTGLTAFRANRLIFPSEKTLLHILCVLAHAIRHASSVRVTDLWIWRSSNMSQASTAADQSPAVQWRGPVRWGSQRLRSLGNVEPF